MQPWPMRARAQGFPEEMELHIWGHSCYLIPQDKELSGQESILYYDAKRTPRHFYVIGASFLKESQCFSFM